MSDLHLYGLDKTSDLWDTTLRSKERKMEMPFVYNVRTNLSLVDFEVIADDENEALHTAEVILNQLVVRDVQQGREVV